MEVVLQRKCILLFLRVFVMLLLRNFLLAKGSSDQVVLLQLGYPHLVVWNVWLRIAFQIPTKKLAIDPSVKESFETLKTYANEYSKKHLKEFVAEVQYAYIEKHHDPEFKKMMVMVRPDYPSDRVWVISPTVLSACSNVLPFPGQAPPGDLEEQVQAWLGANAQ